MSRIPRIKRLRISNFRSLGENVDLELGALTVLVGPNGAGKSNVADAFHFLADCMHIGLEGAITRRHGIKSVRRFSTGHPFNMSFHVELDTPTGTAGFQFELTGSNDEEYRVKSEHVVVINDGEPAEYQIDQGKWVKSPGDLRPRVDDLSLALPLVAGDRRFAPLADTLRRIAVYSIFPDALRKPQTYEPTKPMERHGANWVSILKDQPAETWKGDLVAVLDRLAGDVIDVRVQSVAGYLTVEFEHTQDAKHRKRRPKWFGAGQESDGTLRVAGMVTALLQQPRPTLVALEEPELTVHPGALRLLNDYVVQAAAHGQVLLTTHSPDLLDLLPVDVVRVVGREAGVTSVARLDEAQLGAVKDTLFSLGELHRTEGLKGQRVLFEDKGG